MRGVRYLALEIECYSKGYPSLQMIAQRMFAGVARDVIEGSGSVTFELVEKSRVLSSVINDRSE